MSRLALPSTIPPLARSNLGNDALLATASVQGFSTLFIVEFKAGRKDFFYTSDSEPPQGIRVGDLVIVEADRGRDLGRVVNDTVTVSEVNKFNLEHHDLDPGHKITPKRLIGKAQAEEIQSMSLKTADESKVVQLCQAKVRAKKLPMEIVDAEYQLDRRQLTIYFVAEKSVDCRELAKELFRLYKTRIRMASLKTSAVTGSTSTTPTNGHRDSQPVRPSEMDTEHQISDTLSPNSEGVTTYHSHHDTDVQRLGAPPVTHTQWDMERPSSSLSTDSQESFIDPSHPLTDSDAQSSLPNDKNKKLMARIQELLTDKHQYKKLLACKGSSAQSLLDMFQHLLDISPNPSSNSQRSLIVATQRLAAASELYPMSYELTDVTASDLSECSGGYADIYKGNFRGRVVCLKTVRLHKNTDMAHFVKVVSREAVLWGQLRHPNVLPFYGIYHFRGRISLVAPWMENGHIGDYLKLHTTSNRVVLAYDVAQGLKFLHKNGIIHGDLKGTNILVNEMGRACLADFGLSSISDKNILAWTSYSSAASKGGTVRWQAPELFEPEGDEEKRNTEASDVYAWACVAYEIFAGQVPLAHLNREATIIKQVSNGERPARPLETSPSWTTWGLNEDIWSLMEVCWSMQPEGRPTVQVIIDQLALALPLDPEVDANDSSLSPGAFRELARRTSDKNSEEMSIDTLEALLFS